MQAYIIEPIPNDCSPDKKERHSSYQLLFDDYISRTTPFRYCTRSDDPIAPVTSDKGSQYVETAINAAQQDAKQAITTLQDKISDTPTTEAVLNDKELLAAADVLGQVRGPSVYLYGPSHALPIRTSGKLNQVIDEIHTNRPEGEPHVTPITLSQ